MDIDMHADVALLHAEIELPAVLDNIFKVGNKQKTHEVHSRVLNIGND